MPLSFSVCDLPQVLREVGQGKPFSYAEFIKHALYHPKHGYYIRPGRMRVGHHAEADFYTSESLGAVFARLAARAAWERAGARGDLTLVEIGAEPDGGITMHACPPFSAAQVRRVGASLEGLPPCVVFCNELLDAQPFNRLVFSGGRWVELGVAADAEGLHEVLLPEPSPEVAARLHEFPSSADEGYRIDLPLGAERILALIARQPGVQAIVAYDYGLDWEDLCRRRPAGTARAYRRQQLVPSLLENPGGQDITCHVCWDHLERVLRAAGFDDIRLERQEAHIVRHAVPEIERIVRQGTLRERATLNELLHPARMGSAFQVLSARRGS